MVKAEGVIGDLQSSDVEVRRTAIRFIKNEIIGNKAKKRHYAGLGVIKKLIEILASDNDEGITIQSAAAIGSFACGSEENIVAVNDAGAARILLKALTHSNQKVVETAARSLKIVFLSKHCSRAMVFEGNTSQLIVSLLGHPNDTVKEVAATVIAKSCDDDTSDRRQLYIGHGALDALIRLLYTHTKTQETALEATAALIQDNMDLCRQIVSRENGAVVDMITKFVKDNRPRTRLAAASIIASLNQTKTLPPQYQHLTKLIIPTIIRLFAEESAREDAPQVLARLIGYNEDLQLVATEAEAIPKLGKLLQSATNDRQRESILNALANIASLQDECRKQIVDHKLLGTIVSLLGSENIGVRTAACRCTRSLSRSIKQLRTSLVDAGVATPLFKLLDDSSLEVQTEASATICNIVLDFSPLKKEVIANGGLPRIVNLLSSMDPTLRLNALWALKNLAYDSELKLKEAIINEVTFKGIYELLFDSDYAMQEQGLALVRNLAFKDVESIFVTDAQISELLTAIERIIDMHVNNSRTGVLVQALYLISNIATGSEKHKNAIISSRLAHSIVQFMDHVQGCVRVAAVWCVTNLGWSADQDAGTTSSQQSIIAKLIDIGVEEKLISMADDPDMDVRDRANNALCLIEKSADRMEK